MTNKVILEEEAEAYNVIADTCSPNINKINDMINKVENLKINDIGNNLINKVANLIINDVGNDSNRATVRDVQVQFAVIKL